MSPKLNGIVASLALATGLTACEKAPDFAEEKISQELAYINRIAVEFKNVYERKLQQKKITLDTEQACGELKKGDDLWIHAAAPAFEQCTGREAALPTNGIRFLNRITDIDESALEMNQLGTNLMISECLRSEAPIVEVKIVCPDGKEVKNSF